MPKKSKGVDELVQRTRDMALEDDEQADHDGDVIMQPAETARPRKQQQQQQQRQQHGGPRRKPSPARVEEITDSDDDDDENGVTTAPSGAPQQRKPKTPKLPKGAAAGSAPLSAMQRRTMQQRNKNGVKGLGGKRSAATGSVQVEDELIDEEELEARNRGSDDDEDGSEEEEGSGSELGSDDDGIVWETPAQARAKKQAAALAAAQAAANPPSRCPSLCSLLLWAFLLASAACLLWIRLQDASFLGASDMDMVSSDPSQTEDLYTVLDVSRSAKLKDIKAAYRRAVMLTHPDKNPNCADCVEKFQKVQKAYDVLSNSDKRSMYDSIETTFDLLPSESVELTAANWGPLVLQGGDDVWVIQVYADWFKSAIRFAPAWEEAVARYGAGGLVRFGRVHAQREAALIKSMGMPVKFGMIPTVLFWAEGQFKDTKVFMDSAGSALPKLARWIGTQYPNTIESVPSSVGGVEEFMTRAQKAATKGSIESEAAAVLFVPDFAKQQAQARKQQQQQAQQQQGGGSNQQRFRQQMLQDSHQLHSINDPSLLLKSIARKFQYAFSFGQVQQIDEPANWKAWMKNVSARFKLRPPSQLPALLYQESASSPPLWLSGDLNKEKLLSHMDSLHRRRAPWMNSHAFHRHCMDTSAKQSTVCVIAMACSNTAASAPSSSFVSFQQNALSLRATQAFKNARLQFAKVDVAHQTDMEPLCQALPEKARMGQGLNIVVVADHGATMYHTRESEHDLAAWLQHIVKSDGTVPSLPTPYVPAVHIPADVLALQVPGMGLVQIPLRWLAGGGIVFGLWLFAPFILSHLSTFLQIIFALSIAVPAYEFSKDLFSKYA